MNFMSLHSHYLIHNQGENQSLPVSRYFVDLLSIVFSLKVTSHSKYEFAKGFENRRLGDFDTQCCMRQAPFIDCLSMINQAKGRVGTP
jgi:hypothetical protein